MLTLSSITALALVAGGTGILTVTLLFLVAALICAILGAMGNKCPWWVPVLCLCVAGLVQVLPKD